MEAWRRICGTSGWLKTVVILLHLITASVLLILIQSNGPQTPSVPRATTAQGISSPMFSQGNRSSVTPSDASFNFSDTQFTIIDNRSTWNLNGQGAPGPRSTLKQQVVQNTSSVGKKLILYLHMGQHKFIKPGMFGKCPFSNCVTTTDVSRIREADTVLLNLFTVKPHFNFGWIKKHADSRPLGQTWVFFLDEALSRIYNLQQLNSVFNYSASYFSQSDVILRYGYTSERTLKTQVPTTNYAAKKSRQVAWTASHCSTNSHRELYVHELRKYIHVDIYGKCGNLSLKCSDKARCGADVIQKYKFYLAFENTNCKDYLTEKIFRTLTMTVVPVVLGGKSKADYSQTLPPNSFIYAKDFDSPQKLANYLHLLDTNDTLYNEYFRWKSAYQVYNRKSYPTCDICRLPSTTPKPKLSYSNMVTVRQKLCTN